MQVALTSYGPVPISMEKVRAIEFTKHALERARERRIPKADLAVAVTRPTHVLRSKERGVVRVVDKYSRVTAVLRTDDGSVLTTYHLDDAVNVEREAIRSFNR